MPKHPLDDADQSRRFLDAASQQMEDEAIPLAERRARFEATVRAVGSTGSIIDTQIELNQMLEDAEELLLAEEREAVRR